MTGRVDVMGVIQKKPSCTSTVKEDWILRKVIPTGATSQLANSALEMLEPKILELFRSAQEVSLI